MINALHHIAIGVSNIDTSYRFYRDVLGFSIKLLDCTQTLPPDNSGKYFAIDRAHESNQHRLRTLFALHPCGGAGIELFELPTRERPSEAKPLRWGDLGAFELGVRVQNLTKFNCFCRAQGVSFLCPSFVRDGHRDPFWQGAYLTDPDGLLIQVLEGPLDHDHRLRNRSGTLGIHHLGIGVSQLAPARQFYSEFLGFDKTLLAWKGAVPEILSVPAGPQETEALFLERSQPSQSDLNPLNRGAIKLVKVANQEGPPTGCSHRKYGELGLTEIALDVRDIDSLIADFDSQGTESLLAKSELDMGPGSRAWIALFADPFSGATIELVKMKRLLFLPPKLVSPTLALAEWLNSLRPTNLNLSALFTLRVPDLV